MLDSTELNNQQKKLFSALGLAWELGYIIAIPIAVLALVGRWVDKSFNTSPLFLLVGVFGSMIISGVLIVKKTKSIVNNQSEAESKKLLNINNKL